MSLPADDPRPSLAARSGEMLQVESELGTWAISRLSRPVEEASYIDGCAPGRLPDGAYPTEVICTVEYGELLLLDDDGSIIKAFPMPGAQPTISHETLDSTFLWFPRSRRGVRRPRASCRHDPAPPPPAGRGRGGRAGTQRHHGNLRYRRSAHRRARGLGWTTTAPKNADARPVHGNPVYYRTGYHHQAEQLSYTFDPQAALIEWVDGASVPGHSTPDPLATIIVILGEPDPDSPPATGSFRLTGRPDLDEEAEATPQLPRSPCLPPIQSPHGSGTRRWCAVLAGAEPDSRRDRPDGCRR
ncbi:MAG: hypothetical protein GY713_11575 [Actinomycetia bacterium]|nr:hypothetical protein [Actinomycetes bacterium]